MKYKLIELCPIKITNLLKYFNNMDILLLCLRVFVFKY